MSLDVLYVSYNRLEMTRETFAALATNTNWEHVHHLYIADDASTDGTREWLNQAADQVPVPVVFCNGRFGGPVAATTWYLSKADETVVDRFAKIDNDFIVCPDWLDEVLHQMTIHPDYDVFGIEPRLGPAVDVPCPHRTIEEARFIGGKGIIRLRTFENCWPRPSGFNGYQGWSQWQTEHEHIKKGWVRPDLPCFGIDQLPFEPWRSMTAEHVAKGWTRPWSEYVESMESYWSWWKPVHL